LSLHDPKFGDFAHIEVAQLNSSIFVEENVGTFDVSVDDLAPMKLMQAKHHLLQDHPDFALTHNLAMLSCVFYFGIEVATVSHLHDDA